MDAGHGEFGESAADIKSSKLKRMAFEKFKAGSDQRAKVNTLFIAFEEKSKTKLNHEMVIDDRGNIRDDYTVIMSMQDSKGNAKDASDKEGPARTKVFWDIKGGCEYLTYLRSKYTID